jgi:anti-sigma regulatory factor (Ser/Thr protein kinase)
MVEWSFDTRDAQAARAARIDFVKHVNRFFGSSANVAAAELVLGELIGNVVRHAPGQALVKADFDDAGITIAVQDSGTGFSEPAIPSPDDILSESGRGLAIVLKLADSLEVERQPDDGCCVRARLDVPAGPR